MPAAPPLGNKNAVKPKVWSDAIRRALVRREAGNAADINKLADVLLDKCADGDMTALKEFGDRIEGKVPQALVGDAEHEPIRLTISSVDADL